MNTYYVTPRYKAYKFCNYNNKNPYDFSVNINSFVLQDSAVLLRIFLMQAQKPLINTVFIEGKRYQ